MKDMKIQRRIADYLSRPRDIIRKQRVKQRQQACRDSVLNSVRGFLMADTFMYGPLTAKTYDVPGIRYMSGAERDKRSDRNSPVRILKELLSSPDDIVKDSEGPIKKAIEQLEESSEASGQVVQSTYVRVQKTVTTTTTVVDDENGEVRSSLTGIPHQDTATPKFGGGDAELTEPEADADEEHSWSHEGHDGGDDFQDHIPLDKAVAEQVANQLIAGLGGRFSDDLGIDVDSGDSKVECWFLAANLFTRSVSFEVSKNTYKELSEAGVSNVTDLLTFEESRLAAIAEKTGYTKYGQRVASQLRKLANHLEANNWGRVSTFKHISDNHELIRQLRSLPGVRLSTVRIFLRELRGLWKGAPPEFDMRTKKAAMHLKLLGSIKVSSHPENVLSEFAHYAGIDLRDLEVALFKLGTDHEHQYGECPGASDCKVLLPSEKLIASLPSDALL